jgi:hypothetical protein
MFDGVEGGEIGGFSYSLGRMIIVGMLMEISENAFHIFVFLSIRVMKFYVGK